MPKNAIIVGMPRSGTSLAASIFANHGYFAAEDSQSQLRCPDEYNPSGYWEAEILTRYNAEVFSAVGFEYDNTWLFEPISLGQADAINKLVLSEEHKELIQTYNLHAPWVLKDPRFCYTLGYWWPAMDCANTCVLFVRRDPMHILNSFVRLKWCEENPAAREDVLQRITHHLAAAEKALKTLNIPYLSIDYSDYANKPEETASLINEYFDLELVANDLGYSKRFNNSSLRGRLETKLQKIIDKFPVSWVKTIKRCMPRFILKKLFPAKKL